MAVRMAIPSTLGICSGLRNQFAVIAAILEQMFRMCLLKVAASDLMTRDLRRNRKYRHAVPMAIEQAIDEVKIARAATACAHSDLSGKMSLRTGGKRGHLFMPHVQPFDLSYSSG